MKKRVFISFDYDHDSDIKGSLVGLAKYITSSLMILYQINMDLRQLVI